MGRQLHRAPIPFHLLPGVDRTIEVLREEIVRTMKLLDVSARRQEEVVTVGALKRHAFFSRVLLRGRMRLRNCSR